MGYLKLIDFVLLPAILFKTNPKLTTEFGLFFKSNKCNILWGVNYKVENPDLKLSLLIITKVKF